MTGPVTPQKLLCKDGGKKGEMLSLAEVPERMRLTRAFGKMILRYRNTRQLTRLQLAQQAGVPKDFIKALETRGNKTGPKAQVEALMAILGITEMPPEEEPKKVQMWWLPPPEKRTFAMSLEARKLLRKHRRALGLKLTDVAERINETNSVCQIIEHKNVRSVPTMRVAKMASIVQVSQGSPLGRYLRTQGFLWARPDHVPQIKKRVDWSKVPLGTKSDCEIAQELSVNVGTVQRARSRAGIPPYKGPKRAPKKLEVPYTAAQLQEELGDPPVTDGRVNWAKTPLGCTADKEVAKWLRVKATLVRWHRNQRGIPCYQRIRWDMVPLGEYPDGIIAEWVGLSTAAIATARKRKGIRPAPRHTRRSEYGVYPRGLQEQYFTLPGLVLVEERNIPEP